MILAIPILEGKISEYFRKAKQFKLFVIKNTKVVATEIIETLEMNYLNICKILHLSKVKLVLGARIETHIVDLLDLLNIDSITGAHGCPDLAIENLLKNKSGLIEDYESNMNNEEDSKCSFCN